MPASSQAEKKRAISLSNANIKILNAFNRLLALLDEPDSIPILAPLIQREILYRLLISEQGAFLRKLALSGNQNNQISRIITSRSFTEMI